MNNYAFLPPYSSLCLYLLKSSENRLKRQWDQNGHGTEMAGPIRRDPIVVGFINTIFKLYLITEHKFVITFILYSKYDLYNRIN